MPSMGRILERLTVAVDGDTSDAERKLHGLSDESKGGSWVGKLGGASSKAGAAVAFGVAGGIAAMAGIGLAASANAEQSEIAFTSIMGDAGKAKSFLADLAAFAARTPFELPGLKDAASRMLAVGTDASRVIPIMTALGDSTSAMGTGAEGIDRAVTALTQMQVKGKVTGEEMLQLAEAGVPAWDALATVLGVSVAEAQKKVSAGQVEAGTLFTALETKAGPSMQRVAGMMDKQSASAMGMLSTFKDVATQGLGEMMTPALAEIKKMAPQITAVMGDTFKTLGPAIAGLIPALLDLFKSLGALIPGFIQGLTTVLPIISKMVGVFAQVIKVIPPAVIMGIVSAFMLFGPVASIFSALSAILPVLGAGFTILLGPVGLVIAAVAALAAIGYVVYRNWDTIAAFFDRSWEWIKRTFQTGVAALVGFLESLPGRALDALLALPGMLGALATDAVRMLLLGWYTIVFELPKALVDALPGVAAAAWGLFKKVNELAWDGIVALAGFFWELPGMAIRGFGDAGKRLWHIGVNLIGGLWNGAAEMWNRMWGFLTGLPGEIWRALGDAPGMLYGYGRNVVVGLWNGLVSMGSWLWDKVYGWIKDVLPGPIARALGMASPSKVMAGLGVNAAEGLAQGILGSTGMVASAADALASAVRPNLGSFATSAGVGSGSAYGGGAQNIVLQLPSGAIVPWSEVGRNVRVMFVDDGGRNAFSAAAG